jgi:hypothetical protein
MALPSSVCRLLFRRALRTPTVEERYQRNREQKGRRSESKRMLVPEILESDGEGW